MELLVVVAIIAILAAMLLPSLKGVRDRAKGIQCMNHLRQWGVLITLYTSENDGLFPEATPVLKNGWNVTWNHYWAPLANKLNPEPQTGFTVWNTAWMRGDNINGCPTKPSSDGPSPRYYSYLINWHLTHPLAVPHIPQVASVPDPARILMLVDASLVVNSGLSSQFGQTNNVGYVHNRHANVLYVDGHVSSVPSVDNSMLAP